MNTTTTQRGIALDGAKLRAMRRQSGWTQGELAVAAEVSDDAVSRAERGIAISLENAKAIAAALVTDLATLGKTAPAADPVLAPTAIVAASNIPIRVPAYFLGRDEAMAEIEAALEKHQGRVAITALHGLRGVGKTALAAAFADRHAEAYRATWWIRAETEATMRADLAGLGVRLGWVGPEAEEEPATAAVLERLTRDGSNVLLIFDNALTADAIRPYLPRGGGTHALITSNAHVWRSVATPIRLDTWPEETGAEFLTRRTGRHAERDAALELTELLGGLPLAHEQAAAYCERLEIPLAEYARRFKEAPSRLLDSGRDAAADYHDRTTVANTFKLAIDAVANRHPGAETLIVWCALLAPEPIPLFLFTETLGEEGGPFAGDGLDDAVGELLAFALIDRESISDERDPSFTTDTIRLHRLVREVAAARCPDRDAALATLIAAMAATYPRDVENNPAAWRRARRLDAPALALVAGDPPDRARGSASYLLDRLATYRRHALATYAEARHLFERALESDERALGPDHPDTLTGVNNLASCLRALGDAAAALPLFRRALESSERVLGPDQPDTLTSINNLAGCLETLGDAAAALPLYRRALEGSERVLGPDQPDTLMSINNLASCQQALGDAAAALPLFRRALESRERVLGPDHPNTLMSINNLASCQQALGDAAAALPLYRRALESCERVLGPDHPDTLTSVNNLASCLEALGDAAAALPLYRRALESCERVLGPDHPDTLTGVNNLAGCLRALGDAAAALPLCRRALAGFEKVLGPEHPTTRVVRGNLAVAEAEVGGGSHPPS